LQDASSRTARSTAVTLPRTQMIIPAFCMPATRGTMNAEHLCQNSCVRTHESLRCDPASSRLARASLIKQHAVQGEAHLQQLCQIGALMHIPSPASWARTRLPGMKNAEGNGIARNALNDHCNDIAAEITPLNRK
jgi:hypothetical protein